MIFSHFQMSRTLLYHAMEIGNPSVISILLKHDADPNIGDEVSYSTVCSWICGVLCTLFDT